MGVPECQYRFFGWYTGTVAAVRPPAALSTLVVLLLAGVAGCGPPPTAVAQGSPSAAQAAPAVTPNPGSLAPNDCIAPPPTKSTTLHSPVLGVSVRVPAGWAEDPTMEGQQGLQAAFDLAQGTGRNAVSITAYPWPMAMSPHEAIDWMVSQPAAGPVDSRGDCTIGGGKAAYFESTIALTPFPGITFSSGGYSLVIGHGTKLVYLIIIFPTDSRDTAMPQVKSILGSWKWDKA
jgi:hypothetical protein